MGEGGPIDDAGGAAFGVDGSAGRARWSAPPMTCEDEMKHTTGTGRVAIWVAAAMSASCGPPPPGQYAGTVPPPCASVQHAQHAGYTDGISGHASQVTWYTSSCPPETRDALAAGYAEAHGRGLAEYQAALARNAEAARQAEAQRVHRLCTDPAAAFQAGYNTGYQRAMMSADWADQYCEPAYRAGTKQQYLAGYQAGMGQAPPPPPPPPVTPVIVVAPRHGRAAAASSQASCRFSSDCYEGQSCRHVAQLGHSVCMGDGLRGDHCWFNSDCLSDTCRLHAGGAKTCK